MKRALLAGTFDPPSLGHLDLMQRASGLCQTLYVGIAVNFQKKDHLLFSVKEREEMLKKMTKSLSNVNILSFQGLVITCAKQLHTHTLIRGLRHASDLEQESRMAWVNKKLGGCETVFLHGDPRYAHIHSSLIRELASYKAPLKDFVLPFVEKQLLQRLHTMIS